MTSKILAVLMIFWAMPGQSKSLEAIPAAGGLPHAPELETIMTQLKTYGGFVSKTTEEKVIQKEPSRGQRMVEEAKARNRAILAQKRAEAKADAEAGIEEDGPEQWKKQTREQLDTWKRETREQLQAWKREQEIFLGHLKEYKEVSVPLPVKEEKIIEKKVTTDLPEVTVVASAFDVPIKDQKARPTCAAFAGVRAMETLLAQNNLKEDLSEQYFYWASKPNCQTGPCHDKGSWVTPGLKLSQSAPMVDIPEEKSCSYNEVSRPNNETQVPLANSCHQGAVKVEAFNPVRTIADVVDMLKRNIPVILGATLTENFYLNQGLILLSEAAKSLGVKLDGHASGHAFLAVGVVELPQKLQASEGRFCLLVANSWGKGWGAGGYSCVSENWLAKYRVPTPFMAVTKVRVP